MSLLLHALLLLPRTAPAAVLSLAGPAAAPVAAPLSGLRTEGYALLPGPLLTPDARASIVSSMRALPPPLFSREPGVKVMVWERTVGAFPGAEREVPAVGQALDLLGRLDAEVKASLPGESLELQAAELRAQEGEAGGAYLHADGQYLTFTYPLLGPGTMIYPGGAGVPRVEAGEGTAALFTAFDREGAAGLPATIHSAPLGEAPPRVLLVARWLSPGLSKLPAPAERRLREGLAARIQAARRALREAGLPDGGALTDRVVLELLGLAPSRFGSP